MQRARERVLRSDPEAAPRTLRARLGAIEAQSGTVAKYQIILTEIGLRPSHISSISSYPKRSILISA